MGAQELAELVLLRWVAGTAGAVALLLLGLTVKWLWSIAKSLREIEKSVGKIATRAEDTERRVSEQATESKEHGKRITELEKACAALREMRRPSGNFGPPE